MWHYNTVLVITLKYSEKDYLPTLLQLQLRHVSNTHLQQKYCEKLCTAAHIAALRHLL